MAQIPQGQNEYDFRHFYSIVAGISLDVFAMGVFERSEAAFWFIGLAIYFVLPTWGSYVRAYKLTMEIATPRGRSQSMRLRLLTIMWGGVNLVQFFALPAFFIKSWGDVGNRPQVLMPLSQWMPWQFVFSIAWILFYGVETHKDWELILTEPDILLVLLGGFLCFFWAFIPFFIDPAIMLLRFVLIAVICLLVISWLRFRGGKE
jgi:hypothetical protein